MTFDKNLLPAVLDALPVSVLLVDNQSIIRYANKAIESVLGYREEDLVGSPIDCLLPQSLRKEHHKQVQQYLGAPTERAMGGGRVLTGLTKEGKEINIEIGLSPITLNGEQYVITSLLDTTNQVLKISAFNDELTGLPNRYLFTELSENLRHLAIRNHTSISILFIDLDGFKMVNDNYGHDVGDKALCQVADIIHSSTRKNDIGARIGGDEFLVCYYDIAQKGDADKRADTILRKISAIDELDGHPINISASIGMLTTRSPETVTIEAMIKMADALMYQAKHSGKNRTCSSEL